MKDAVLAILREQDSYYSGEVISNRLGVTRTAVWKAVKRLQQQGYQIEAVSNRGYRLVGSPDILSLSEIDMMLKRTQLEGHFPRVFYAAEIDSTNLMARRAAEDGAPHGSVFVAGLQTAGRGRRGRIWKSQADKDLTFSILLRPQVEPAAMSMVTLLAGLCVAEAVNQLLHDMGAALAAEPTEEPTGIKWPNDLVMAESGKKIGGILTDSMVEDNHVQALIIGMGVNVNTNVFPDDLRLSATSLGHACGQTVNRLDLLQRILQRFIDHKASLSQMSGVTHPEEWLDDYRHLCLTLGREVRIVAADGSWQTGRAIDVDPSGELIVEDGQGCRQVIRSGEVSVRGLLGYI